MVALVPDSDCCALKSCDQDSLVSLSPLPPPVPVTPLLRKNPFLPPVCDAVKGRGNMRDIKGFNVAMHGQMMAVLTSMMDHFARGGLSLDGSVELNA